MVMMKIVIITVITVFLNSGTYVLILKNNNNCCTVYVIALHEQNQTRENVAIVMHCNLRPPDVAPSDILCFNCDAHTKFEVGQPIRSRLIAVFTANYAVTLTFDPLTLNVYNGIDCDVIKLCIKL